jgi:hypothetical protein
MNAGEKVAKMINHQYRKANRKKQKSKNKQMFVKHLTVRITMTLAVAMEVKLSLCLTNHHAMKAFWGSGGIVPLFL